MAAFVHTVKKTLFAMLLILLFIAFSVFCGIVFLSLFQWFMHTDFYLNIVNSHEFWLWLLGIPFVILFLIFCTKI
ncbi:hypothetical protein AOX59_02080 [Lentibacillus amyloliquefaciens]|uniref:Uncharacterized protein n=1 Tax=Lentibacillus amyloliquefaciens TaxID=1472767 RepID=A0A0U4F1N1_9BACI|nr:hypothetical protein AOX59_02080 [Lentibacillus amyloliquefaciens]